MNDFWKILGIAPTEDVKVIRRAYASLSRGIHPEDDEQEFLKLKGAYETAMAWVKSKKSKKTLPIRALGSLPVVGDSQSQLFKLFPQEREFSGNPAFEEFTHLYFVVGEPSESRWKQFFTSADFLDVFLEEGFLLHLTKLLRESTGVIISFYKYLFLVYQVYPASRSMARVPLFSKDQEQLMACYQTQGSFMQYIDLEEEDLMFSFAFLDLIDLFIMEKDRNILGEEKHRQLLYCIFAKYHPDALVHTCPSFPEEEQVAQAMPRGFSSLELVACALRTIRYSSEDLSLILEAMAIEEVQRSKSTVRGQFAPVFLVLGRCYPYYFEKNHEYWQQLNKKLLELFEQVESSREAEQLSLVNQFLKQNDDLLAALYDGDYMSSFFLQNLIQNTHSGVLLHGFLRLAQRNPEIEERFTELLLERLWQVYESKQRRAEMSPLCTMENHEYLRYYLASNFPHLQKWLLKEYSVHPEWVEVVIPEERSAGESLEFFGQEFTLYRSRHFWSYYQGETPVMGKCFHYHQLQGLSTEDFWLCLPLAFCSYGDEDEVVEDLVLRFSSLEEGFPWRKLGEMLFLQMAEDYSQLKLFQSALEFTRYGFGDKVGEDYIQFIVTESNDDQGEFSQSHVVIDRVQFGFRGTVARMSTELPTVETAGYLQEYFMGMMSMVAQGLPEPDTCWVMGSQERVLPFSAWLDILWRGEEFIGALQLDSAVLEVCLGQGACAYLTIGGEKYLWTQQRDWRKAENVAEDARNAFSSFDTNWAAGWEEDALFPNQLLFLRDFFRILSQIATWEKN